VNNYDFNGFHYGDSGESREVFNSRGSYTFNPDPRGKHLADLYSHPITQLHKDSEHNHSKPLTWITLLLANCSVGIVADPFLGSGTSMMAAEALGRQCRGIEISPKYCDVILRRYIAKHGGDPARHDGKTWSELTGAK